MRGPRLRLLLVLLVLTALTLTVVDSRRGSPFETLRRGADALFAPADSTVGSAVRATGRALGGLPRLASYRRDNARLEQENAALRAQLRQTDGLHRSDAQLKKLLGQRTVAAYPVVAARVVSVGSTLGFEWTATLDAGSRDGIEVDQTVLSGDGLVGRTKRVGPFSCTVVLLVDPGSTVGGRLARLGGVGLVTGAGAAPLRYELIDADAQVKVGDVVNTTGSDTYVPDVPVGRVTSVEARASALTRGVQVQPFVDVRTLDLVGVVVGPARTATRSPVTR